MAYALAYPLAMPEPARPTFDQIYRDHAAQVWRWTRHLLGPAGEAEIEDVMQEIFIAVNQRLPGFRQEATLTTWIYRIAFNIVCSRRRKERVRRWSRPKSAELRAVEQPDDILTRNRSQAVLYEALDRLGDEQRALLIWFEIEGRDAAEIAELLGIRTTAVWVRVSRARSALRRSLERMGVSSND